MRRLPSYNKADVDEKLAMSWDIVALVKESGGRFLKSDGLVWVEVSDKVAWRKVAHAFRTMRGSKQDV